MTSGPHTSGKGRERREWAVAMPDGLCAHRLGAGPRRERGKGEKGQAAPAGWAGPLQGKGERGEVRGAPHLGQKWEREKFEPRNPFSFKKSFLFSQKMNKRM